EVHRQPRRDTSELATRILGREPASDLAEALYHRSEGNPLFVEALLCCGGEVSRELPESLRDLLLESVRRLPEDTQELLRVASAGGASTGHALLAAVSGLDDAALTRAVRPAVIANVLHPSGDGYAFRHELIREAVHDDLLPGEDGRPGRRGVRARDRAVHLGAQAARPGRRTGPGGEPAHPPQPLQAEAGPQGLRQGPGRGAGVRAGRRVGGHQDRHPARALALPA